MGIIGADGTGKTVLTTNGAGDGVYETIGSSGEFVGEMEFYGVLGNTGCSSLFDF